MTSSKTLTGRTWAVRDDGSHWNRWLWVTGSEGWKGGNESQMTPRELLTEATRPSKGFLVFCLCMFEGRLEVTV